MKLRGFFSLALFLVAGTIAYAGMPSWQWMNGPYVGRAVDISIGSDIQGKVLYAADDYAYLYKSTNEGQLWEKIQSLATPACVVVAPNTPDIAYTGGNWGPDNQVYKTVDRGQNWSSKSSNLGNTSPLCLAVDPSDPNASFVLLGSAIQGGSEVFYRTLNGGDQWFPFNVGTNQMDVFDIAVVPGPLRKLFLAGGNGTDGGFYLSTNDGTSWIQTHPAPPADVRAVAYDATNPLNVWEGENIGTQAAVRKSSDGGLNWSQPYYLPQETFITALAVTASDRVYAATGIGMFLSIDGGQNWAEINNGIYVRWIQAIAVDPTSVQNLYLGGWEAIYRSTDGGQSWHDRVQGMESMTPLSISSCLPDAIYVLGIETVHKSTDQGLSWVTIDDGQSGYTSRYYISAAPTDALRAFYVFESTEGDNFVRRTTNGGQSWGNLFENVQATYTSIAVDPRDGLIAYLAFRDLIGPPYNEVFPLQKSTDGGETWVNKSPGYTDIVSLSIDFWNHETVFAGSGKPNFARVYKTTNGGESWDDPPHELPTTGMVYDICSNSPANRVYARVGSDGIFKSMDGGATWANCGFQGQQIKALTMDHAEPEILYAGLNEDPPTGRTFVTVDGGAAWVVVESRLPSDAEDLAMDVNQPASVYAGTSNSVYSLTPTWQFKSLTSANQEASNYNSQRKLVRQEGTVNLHAVYHSGSSTAHNVYYTTSTDGGNSWSPKVLLGQGKHPAVALDDVGNPQVIWLSDNGSQLLYAYRQGGVWSGAQTIYSVSAGQSVGPPAFCAVSSVVGNRGHVVFGWLRSSPFLSAIRYGWLTLNSSGTLQNVVNVDSNNKLTCTRPSIAYYSTGNTLHAAWTKGTQVYYSSKNLTTGQPWTSVSQISSTSGSHDPNIEVYGDRLHVAWVEPYAAMTQVTYRWKFLPGGLWEPSVPVVRAAGCSSPQMAAGSYCFWDEGENEIYYSFRDPYWGWLTPTNLSNTPERSASPQTAFAPWPMGAMLFCFWTEDDAAPYQEYFTSFTGPLGGFFTLDAGQEQASPYTVHRGGYLQYAQQVEKTVDTDSSCLTYRFDRLDPKMLYLVRASYYQETGSPTGLEVKVDGSVFANLAVPNRSVFRGEAWVPKELYADSVVEFVIRKKSGTLGTLGYLELCQAEPRGKGGPQSSELADLNLPKEFSLGAGYPNPMTSEARIAYALPKASSVDLTVYNVSGQVVNRLVSEASKAPGRYSIRWDGRNDQGFRVPAGVYFYRLKAGGFAETKKIVVVR